MRSQKGRCSFLSAPLEIRHAIYALILPRAVHVFLSRGRLRLSMCLDPNLGDDNHDGRERKPGTDTDTDHEHRSKWARRLRSSWGPHWECEESVYGDCYLDVDSLILLCKQVSLEVSDRLADIATINVTDLDTLVTLLRCDRSGVAFDSRWLKNVRDLRLTFRLPLAFYRKLEDGEEEEEEENMIAGQMSTDSTASRISWARLWPAILESRQLRTLQIWLDHDDPSSWSIAKERIGLRALSAALMARKEALSQANEVRTQAMEVVANLPKLHPAWAAPKSHFTQESESLPFTILRRYRQRYFYEEKDNGELGINYSPDFPEMECFRDPEVLPEWPLEEIEDIEREAIERGEDVTNLFNELATPSFVCY